jgi:hypothetical protein
MEIRIESCKGNVTVDSFGLAGEWLEEMQPSYATVTVDGLDIGSVEDLANTSEDGSYVAARADKALRREHRRHMRADADV